MGLMPAGAATAWHLCFVRRWNSPLPLPPSPMSWYFRLYPGWPLPVRTSRPPTPNPPLSHLTGPTQSLRRVPHWDFSKGISRLRIQMFVPIGIQMWPDLWSSILGLLLPRKQTCMACGDRLSWAPSALSLRTGDPGRCVYAPRSCRRGCMTC